MTEKTKLEPEQSTIDAHVTTSDGANVDGLILPKNSARNLFRTLRNLLIFLFIIGLLSAGWFFWQDWQLRIAAIDKTSATVESLLRSVKNNQAQFKLSQDSQARQLQWIQQLQQQHQNLQLRVNTQGRHLAELGSTTRSDWLLAEAEYLARLAAQRLQTERSTKNPLALLENIDAILKELDEPELHLVRSAVAQDITDLRLAGDIDREGIYLELQALATKLERLPLIEFSLQSTSDSQRPDNMQANENSIFTEFVREMGSLIRIRQRETPIEPMLQPTEILVVRRNLQMMLEQSQVALLREEQGIYDQSLAKAQGYLKRFFQFNPSVQTVHHRLSALMEKRITQTLPEINRSLEALQTLRLVRQQRLTADDGAVQSGAEE